MAVYLFQIKHFVAFSGGLKAADRCQNRLFQAKTRSMDVYLEIKPARL
jgi:exonuclease VII small subunit